MSDARTPDKKLSVFISYSRKDLTFALQIVTALGEHGVAAKIDTRDLPKLEDWRRELLGFIREADAVIFIVSSNSISSPVCAWEVEQVAKLNKRLAPIVLERVPDDRIPAPIAKINYIFFDDPSEFETQSNTLAQALQLDLAWLKDHTRLGELARRWEEKKRPTVLLLRGQELQAAENWIASRPRGAPEPTQLHRDFIAHSRRNATRRSRLALATTLILAVIGFGLAAFAYWQRGQAELQRQVAETQRFEAEKQRNQVYINQSKFLSQASLSATKAGNTTLGTLLALVALPEKIKTPNRPLIPEAAGALESAMKNRREKRILAGNRAHVFTAVLSKDGSQALTTAEDKTIKLWDVVKGSPLLSETVSKEPTDVESTHSGEEVVIFPQRDGARLAEPIAAVDFNSSRISVGGKVSKLYREQEAMVDGLPVEVRSYEFSPDGKFLVTSLQNNNVILWDATKRSRIAEFREHHHWVDKIVFAPTNDKFVTISGDSTARLWNVAKKSSVATMVQDGEITDAIFSPDGLKLITTARSDTDTKGGTDRDAGNGSVTIWDTKRGIAISQLLGMAPAKSVAFSPNSSRVVSGSDDGTASVWEVNTGKRIAVLVGHEAAIRFVRFSADGALVITASDDCTARIWSVEALPLPKIDLNEPNELQTLIDTAKNELTRSLSRDEVLRYFLDSQDLSGLTSRPSLECNR